MGRLVSSSSFWGVFQIYWLLHPAKTYPLELFQSYLIIYFLAIKIKQKHQTLSTLGQATFLNFWHDTTHQKKNIRGSINTTFWLSVFFLVVRFEIWNMGKILSWHPRDLTLKHPAFLAWFWYRLVTWHRLGTIRSPCYPNPPMYHGTQDSKPPTVVTFQIYSHFFHFHDYGEKE